MNRHKLLTFITVLVLATLIGVMSWHGMHPTPEGPKKKAVNLHSYYVGHGINADFVSKDQSSLTILQGTFKQTADGKFTLVPDGMPPTLFAQRQINLWLKFDEIPKDPKQLIADIQKLVKEWKVTGTSIYNLFFDYRPQNPDFPAYINFINAFHKATDSDAYIINMAADLSWLDGPHKTLLPQITNNNVAHLVFDLETPTALPEQMKTLENIQVNFLLRLPASASDAFQVNNEWYKGVLLTLSPEKPLPTQKIQIGIFPKF